jgi:hypothetical protein
MRKAGKAGESAKRGMNQRPSRRLYGQEAHTMAKLTHFEVQPSNPGLFTLTLENDAGERFLADITAEQMDTAIDAMDDLLTDHEEEAFAVEGRATYQKPLG